ncbi:hypothetical protein ABW19_dt0202402 [Dactylella cylindrospora]|nr:hypothetical protein ABW19_dt0202402 [Dactylella cylindrospora]
MEMGSHPGMENGMGDMMMGSPMYRPGKIPVKYNAKETVYESSWFASVNITGEMYDMLIENTSSDTWLYSPMDPYKCDYEAKLFGNNVCYMPSKGASGMHMEATKFLPNPVAFHVNHTGPGFVSGTRIILNNITSNMMDSASWPAVIELVDNVYPLYSGYDSYSTTSRQYQGALCLNRVDEGMARFSINGSDGKPYVPEVPPYPQTPFHSASGWTYFTTNFNMMGPKEDMYLGLQWMDQSSYTGNMTMIKNTPSAKYWAVDPSPEWKIHITSSKMSGDEMGGEMGNTELKMEAAFPTMSNYTAKLFLDLGSPITYVNHEAAKKIYQAFGGYCEHYSWDILSISNEYVCKFPVKESWNETSDRRSFEPANPAQIRLPWGESNGIMIEPSSFIYSLVDGYCTGSFDLNTTVTSCETWAFGAIQPTNAETDIWVYGDIVYGNAFFKWDTMNGGEISMAAYPPSPVGMNMSVSMDGGMGTNMGSPSPSAKINPLQDQDE